MQIDQITRIESIKPLSNGIVEVAYADVTLLDGREIERVIRRKVLPPGDDASNEDIAVLAICNALWTPEVIAAYHQQQAV